MVKLSEPMYLRTKLDKEIENLFIQNERFNSLFGELSIPNDR